MNIVSRQMWVALLVLTTLAVPSLGQTPECDSPAVYAPDTQEADDYFGVVSLSGNWAAVGALLHDSADEDAGAVYLYRHGAGWQFSQKITPDMPEAGEQFGSSVSLYGSTIVVGAPWYLSQRGRVQIFDYEATGWEHVITLTASDGTGGDYFGGGAPNRYNGVGIYDGTVVVGAAKKDILGDNDVGQAYVFVRNPTTGVWSQDAILNAGSDMWPGAQFGHAVAIYGNRIAVSAPYRTAQSTTTAGKVYVFTKNLSTGQWVMEATLNISSPVLDDRLGWSLALGKSSLIAGSMGEFAAVFTDSGSGWSEEVILTASDGVAGDEFGFSVAIAGSMALVGARNRDYSANVPAGAAYLFSRTPTPGVWNEVLIMLPDVHSASQGDRFGETVAMSDDFALVGAIEEDPPGGPHDGGAVYRYQSLPSCP